MATQTSEEWHPGSVAMHRLMSAPEYPDPTSMYLTPSSAHLVQSSPLLAVGMLDSEGRPWTSIWGGEKGFASPVKISDRRGGPGTLAIATRCLVDSRFDPVVQILHAAMLGEKDEQSPIETPRQISGLAIDLVRRTRTKLSGTVLAVSANHGDEKREALGESVIDMQMVMKVESSLTNCPKYLNQKTIIPSIPSPEVEPLTFPPTLSPAILSFLETADLFFLTTTHNGTHYSTNHRGGPPGFIRHVPDSSPPQLVSPEYSGNRLYQSLGNMYTTPVAGIVIPDFQTSDVFFATASARILSGKDASSLLPRSNLVVVFTLIDFRFVRQGLAFKAALVTDPSAPSPYNPPVRYLTSEKNPDGAGSSSEQATATAPFARATLIDREILAPDIARYTFALSDFRRDSLSSSKPLWTPGQHVAFSFANELDNGYSHMRDDDPQSLNDDWVRTFTVSSVAPGATEGASAMKPIQFSVTVRAVGTATRHLLRVPLRAGLELPVIGFAGDFSIRGMDDVGGEVAFVAGGIGITPLLAQLSGLLTRGLSLSIWWAVRGSEAGFATSVIRDWLLGVQDTKGKEVLSVRLFVAGKVDGQSEAAVKELGGMEMVHVHMRRLQRVDFEGETADRIKRWYLCAGKALGATVEAWLGEMGKDIVKESFNY